MMTKLKPVEIKHPELWGFDLIWYFKFASFFAWAAFAWSHLILLEVDMVQQTCDAICHGNVDFVYQVTPSGLLSWAYSDAPPKLVPDHLRTLTTDTVRELQNLGHSQRDGHRPPALDEFYTKNLQNGWLSMSDVDRLDRASYSNFANSLCVDQITWESDLLTPARRQATVRLLEEKLGVPIPSCEAVSPFCAMDNHAGSRARQFCPETCGCNTPASKLMLTRPIAGCPESCAHQPIFKEALRAAPCSELPVENLTKSSRWLSFAKSLEDILPGVSDKQVQYYVHQYATLMKKHGCEAVKKLPGGACRWDSVVSPFRSMAFDCPLSCGCVEEWQFGCPEMCRKS
jgi:hypothetical protein